jgi:hypothetical protein
VFRSPARAWAVQHNIYQARSGSQHRKMSPIGVCIMFNGSLGRSIDPYNIYKLGESLNAV